MKPSLTLVEEERILDGRSRDENRAFNMQLMRVSKSTAVAVALRYLGIDPFRPTGVGLAQVQVDGPSTGKLTINDVILKAAASAAVAEPRVNASFDGNAIIQYANVNLSVAIALDDGLVTPVIRSAQENRTLKRALQFTPRTGARYTEKATTVFTIG